LYGPNPSEPVNKREELARQFIASWVRRHPDFGLWEPRHTPNTLASRFLSDPEFPGAALSDFLGRPDVRSIETGVERSAWSPYGSIAGLEIKLVTDAVVLACDTSSIAKRRGWKAVAAAALIIGGSALISKGKSTETTSSLGPSSITPETSNRNDRRGTKVAQIKRVFIAFAKEDERIRDLIKGQSLNDATPFEYVDMSVKEPYSSEWKDRVRVRIRGSDGVIALLSKASLTATGELWEIQCAVEERKPLLGLYIYKDDHTKPAVMGSSHCIVWSWDGIGRFVNNL
jgi:hypothetical protein